MVACINNIVQMLRGASGQYSRDGSSGRSHIAHAHDKVLILLISRNNNHYHH